ncbi:hypothetical protein KCP75_07725 [Salmonella enterica subsp. enterica]|nr:hypothetical protein KCP75_07725 [Salmonella enterica subsp. enterica]
MGKLSVNDARQTGRSPAIHVYGNAAVAEFDWHFTRYAVIMGRLSLRQAAAVWAKIPNTGWRIVHVHYSGPAKPALEKAIKLCSSGLWRR